MPLGSLCISALSFWPKGSRHPSCPGTKTQLCLPSVRINPTSYCGKTKTLQQGEGRTLGRSVGLSQSLQLAQLGQPGHALGIPLGVTRPEHQEQ